MNSLLNPIKKLLLAFIGAYLTALVPSLSAGNWPPPSAWIAAIVPALLATHLFQLPSPLSQGGK